VNGNITEIRYLADESYMQSRGGRAMDASR
jgi:hypothetical protein